MILTLEHLTGGVVGRKEVSESWGWVAGMSGVWRFFPLLLFLSGGGGGGEKARKKGRKEEGETP